MNLICNVGSNFFEVFDIDGESVDSGYILIGNSSNLLSNCSIDENGKARFWWVKTTPYNYNYTIKYKDALYNPSEITLAEGVLTVPNIPSNPNMINTNLTTVNFTIVGNDDITPVPGAKLILRRSDNWDSIVNLTTNIYGKTTLRWLNSSGFILGAIVNYSLKIDFFGFPLFFNSTGAGYSDDPYNFTVIAKTSYTFKVDVNPTEYSTELISLNPPSLPPIEWGIQLKVRALFNVTDAGGIGDVGPINPDYMFYNILDGTKSVLSGNMVREEGKIGIYQGIIDTTKLQSDKPYLIQISAMKLGYTSPEPLDIVLFITLNHMILNQSENDDSPIEVRWLETAEMTVKPYGEDTEIMIIGDDLFIGENNRVEISIPDLHTTWNLSKIEFNLELRV